MSALKPQYELARMAPYGYGSYPRTESTQIDLDVLPKRSEQLLHNRQLIPEYEVHDEFFEDLKSADIESLRSQVTEIQSEEEPVSTDRQHTTRSEETQSQQEINVRLPEELTRTEEEFCSSESGNEDPLDLLLG